MIEDNFNDDISTPTEADLNDCYGSKYLSAADLGDKKIRTRIAKIRKEPMRQQSGTERPKFVIYFTNLDKPMVLNATNKIALVDALGSLPADWIGAEVGIYAENTQFAGKPVKGLRLRMLSAPKRGAASKTEPAKPPKPTKPPSSGAAPWEDPEDPGNPGPPDFSEAAE